MSSVTITKTKTPEPVSVPDLCGTVVTEDPSRICRLDGTDGQVDIAALICALKNDKVILIEHLAKQAVDPLMAEVAQVFDLKANLEMQAAFSVSLGTRKKIGDYYMSVNERGQYNIVTPHSEGSHFANIQLASFYCDENTTDGGETVLFNVDSQSALWPQLKEFVIKCRCDRVPGKAEVMKARSLFRVDLLKDQLLPEDTVIKAHAIDPQITLYETLTAPRKIHSRILDTEIFVFWDSISAVDHDIVGFMKRQLIHDNLYKQPPVELTDSQIDWDPVRRNLNSNIDYSQLFSVKLIHKLKPGDFMLLNNLTWVHGVNNWTPGSGLRNVSAAFA